MTPEIRMIYSSVLRLFLNVSVAEIYPYDNPHSLIVRYPEPAYSGVWYIPYMENVPYTEIQLKVHVKTDVHPIWDTFMNVFLTNYLPYRHTMELMEGLLDTYRHFIGWLA